MTTAIAETEPTPDRRPPAFDERFFVLPIDQLLESGHNPRRRFDDRKLHELADSIREKGVVEPLVVRPLITDELSDTEQFYEIVAGARRFRASKLAGLTRVPAVVRNYTDRDLLELFVIENTQRDDLTPLEEAAGYKQLLLVDQTYTAAMIAARIGHSERYVWDRLKLLDLVPEVQAHLEAGRIGVEHAEVLAKLKPAEQRLAAREVGGGLFEPDYALKFDDNPHAPKVKARSVRQLKDWIAHHIRFDVAHAAAAAPLDFGDTAQAVAAAQAGEGRGRKVVSITFAHTCPDGAKDLHERTYGATAWKSAQGKNGQATCEHAVLGVVVAGENYGASFKVCIARDKCKVHWRESVLAKEKSAKLRASGKGTQADKVEKRSAVQQEQSWERRQREMKARTEAWKAISDDVLLAAVNQVKPVEHLTAARAAALERIGGEIGFADVKKHLGAKWYEMPAAALLVSAVTSFGYSSWDTKESGFDQFVRLIAKPLALDVKPLAAIRDQHQRAAAPAPAKAAKKAAKRR